MMNYGFKMNFHIMHMLDIFLTGTEIKKKTCSCEIFQLFY